ncbi:480_t:CDS:2, partial [Entrophospora sp. SA101]
SKVVDFAWHPNSDYDRTIASVSSSSEVNVGLLQVWSPYLPLL